jgi:hypothetical protein
VSGTVFRPSFLPATNAAVQFTHYVASEHLIARPFAELFHDRLFHVQLITKILNIA